MDSGEILRELRRSRCGSVTLGENSYQLFSNTLRTLRFAPLLLKGRGYCKGEV